MEATWTRRTTRALLIGVALLATVAALAVIFVIQEASRAIAKMPDSAERARLAGFPTKAKDLAWHPEEGATTNAWPLYQQLVPDVDEVFGRTQNQGRAMVGYVFDPEGRYPDPIDPKLLVRIEAASKPWRCAFPIRWGESTFGRILRLTRINLLVCCGAVDASQAGDLQRAQDLAAAGARIAAHIGQGILRESVWARSRADRVAIATACQVAARLSDPSDFLLRVHNDLGPEPVLRNNLSGEVVRTYARIDRAGLLPFGLQLPFEDLGKEALKSKALDVYLAYPAKASDDPLKLPETAAQLREMDRAVGKRQMISRFFPRSLEAAAWISLENVARRRLFEALATQGKDRPEPKDPYTAKPFLYSRDGRAAKSPGLDKKVERPGDFTGTSQGDDLIVALATS